MRFTDDEDGKFSADHIKFMRLGFSQNSAKVLGRIEDDGQIVNRLQPIVQSMLQNYIRV
jgi:hypothetical protein